MLQTTGKDPAVAGTMVTLYYGVIDFYIGFLAGVKAFTAAVLLDGYIVRQIKAKEFRQHDPELFALYTCGAIVLVCATVVGFVVPFTLHPLTMPCVPLVVSLLLSRALGSFHRRGM